MSHLDMMGPLILFVHLSVCDLKFMTVVGVLKTYFVFNHLTELQNKIAKFLLLLQLVNADQYALSYEIGTSKFPCKANKKTILMKTEGGKLK